MTWQLHPRARGSFVSVWFLWLTLSAAACMASPLAHAAAVGSGRPATETRAVGGFEAIEVMGSIDLAVTQGAREAVEIRADDNLLPLVETVVEQRGGSRTLVVRFKRGESVYTRTSVQVSVEAANLSALAITGSGNVQVAALKTPALKLSISGSGNMSLRGLATDALDLAITGSGDASVQGSARSLRLTISGSGDASLGSLAAEDVRVRIAGSGDAQVNATKALDVSIAGSGDVTYTGNPAALKTAVAGSGTVSPR